MIILDIQSRLLSKEPHCVPPSTFDNLWQITPYWFDPFCIWNWRRDKQMPKIAINTVLLVFYICSKNLPDGLDRVRSFLTDATH